MVMFQAVFTLAFFGALRFGKRMANSKVEAANHPLGISNISVGQAGLMVSMRRSKTDQSNHRAQLQLAPLQGQGPCPWWAHKTLLAIRPSRPGLLFMHKDVSFLSSYQFTEVWWVGLVALGLLPQDCIPSG